MVESIVLGDEVRFSSLTQYEGSHPLTNPYDCFRSHIATELARTSGIDPESVYSALSRTSTLDHGDLVLPVPKLGVTVAKPKDKATEWCKSIPADDLIRQPVAVGISLRFDYNPDFLVPFVMRRIFKLGADFGKTQEPGLKAAGKPELGKKQAIIEFSSPNIAKEFHVGHLRSTIIGAFVANLYEAVGWNVIRINYMGDWGRQYGLLAVGWQRYGSEQKFVEDPIAHLFEVYVKISADFKPEDDDYKAAAKRGEDTSARENSGLLGEAKSHFKRMEAGDEEALALWNRFRSISIEKYKTTYARLNIEFAVYSGESKVKQETMNEAERILRDRGISETNHGATIIDFKRFDAKKLDVAIIRNRNGTSNYLLRDIGSAMQRWRDFDVDSVTYVIMDEQNIHVQRLFKIMELMGEPYSGWAKHMQHITFGKIKGMSTRKGTVSFLGDVLNDVGEAMHTTMRSNEAKYTQVENPDKVADTLGISSIMIQDMRGKRINAYPFQLERMTAFEGDTGPYLQYAHARLSSIARKSGYPQDEIENADFSLLKDSYAVNLVRLMGAYPDIMMHAYKTLEPSTIVTYLFRL